MPRRLEGKSIFIAGAGGIGNEAARRYASEGAAVLLGDVNEYMARQVAEEIVSQGGRATGVSFDGGDEDSVKKAIARAVSEFGGLDGMHVNYLLPAPGDSDSSVVDIPLDDYDLAMRVNTRGYLLCTRHAIPEMRKRGGGSIVYTSSGAAYQAETVRVAYAMCKSAIHALMRHVATRFGPEGIRANAIAPGIIVHQAVLELDEPGLLDGFRDRCPLRMLGEPRDIAAMGAMLLSDDARFITGQIYSVDGGTTMRA